MDTAALRAGSYARQSKGKAKSVRAQPEINASAIRENGWTLYREYQDLVSASRFADKSRDDWPKVLSDIAARAFDVLTLWESSRGDRDAESWLGLLRLCRDSRVLIHVVTHDRTYNLSKPRDWRTLAEEGIDSHYESEKISLRTARGHQQAAANGRPGPGRAPYGYIRVYDPSTGALVGYEINRLVSHIPLAIITGIASARSISSIVAELNAQGITGPGGGKWCAKTVREIANNPVYMGFRRHIDTLYPGTWPAIVDPDTWWACHNVLHTPGRTVTRPGKQKHLLSYLMTCAKCDNQVCRAKALYRCVGCQTTVGASAADALVTYVIQEWLSRPEVRDNLTSAENVADESVASARNEVATLSAELAGWRKAAIQSKVSPEGYAEIESGLIRRIAEAESRANTRVVPLPLREFLTPGCDIRARWEQIGIPARRAVIRHIAEIRMGPSARRGGPMQPTRLAPSRWRGDSLTWGELWAIAGLPG